MSAADDLGDLLRAGASLARLRVLRVVCPHDRTLVDVLRVNRRDLVSTRLVTEQLPTQWRDGDALDAQGLRHRSARYIAYLDESEPGAWIMAATSRCCARRVDFDWLAEQIDTGRSRVIVD